MLKHFSSWVCVCLFPFMIAVFFFLDKFHDFKFLFLMHFCYFDGLFVPVPFYWWFRLDMCYRLQFTSSILVCIANCCKYVGGFSLVTTLALLWFYLSQRSSNGVCSVLVYCFTLLMFQFLIMQWRELEEEQTFVALTSFILLVGK